MERLRKVKTLQISAALLLGIDAFKKTEQYKKGEKIAGLTPMQRFFLGYALGWLWQP